MIDGFFFVLTVVTAVGCGLVAGFFFAFSVAVMKALGRLPAAEGAAAMQSINVAVITPLFMLALFGTGLACATLAVSSLFMWDEPFAVYLLIGGILYVVGVILLTITYHVPRNDALAAADPNSAGGAKLWAHYLAEWTTWNHVRTATALAAAVVLTIALRVS